MFHFYITLAYIIPNIYVFFRIKNLFIGKAYKLLFVLVYLLLVTIYPLVEIVSGIQMVSISPALANATGYILPFFLYLFIFILLFDLFLLLNRLFKIVKPETRKSFSFRIFALSAIVILSVLVLVAGAINLYTIRVSKYLINVPKRNSKLDHLRVAFVADFHIQENTSLRFVEQFVNKVNALKPDLMIYGGDMIEGDHENETTEAIESAMKLIYAKNGTFGVTGNHEFHRGQDQGTFYRKAQITLLCDTMVCIDNSYYLAGRYDQHIGKRKTVTEVLGSKVPDLPVILMDHRPTELQDVSKTFVDVQFSGHTHNGQMFPINLITHGIYELAWGYKKIRNTHFFVTSGLRLWGPPVKTAGKSEIMLVDIIFE